MTPHARAEKKKFDALWTKQRMAILDNYLMYRRDEKINIAVLSKSLGVRDIDLQKKLESMNLLKKGVA